MSNRQVILKADDYGNKDHINEGIRELVLRGLVTDVSVLINYCGEKDRDLLLKAVAKSPLKKNPGVGILLHVNTVSGSPILPVSKVPTLVNQDGIFLRPAVPTISAWQEYAAKLKVAQVRAEMEAQIGKFQKLFGHPPDALDGHNMILAIPPIDSLGIELAVKYNLALTFPKRFTNKLYRGPFQERFIPDQMLREKYRRAKIISSDNVVARYFNRQKSLRQSINILKTELLNLNSGVTEIFFHPGHQDFLNEASTLRFRQGNVRDYQTLTDPEIIKIIKNLDLVSYKRLSLSK